MGNTNSGTGGSTSAAASVLVKDLASWPIDRVEAALARARTVLIDSSVPEDEVDELFLERLRHLTRLQFWQVFTDVAVIKQLGATGSFLQLGPRVFAAFAKPDDGGHEVVNGIELFGVLALFCTGRVEQQLEFCFHLFDLDRSDTMTIDEMELFLGALTTGSYTVGMTERKPTASELSSLARNMFERADREGASSITCSQFVKWAKSHVASQNLLAAFKKQKDSAPHVAVISSAGNAGSGTTIDPRIMEAKHNVQVATKALLDKLSQRSRFTTHDLHRLKDVLIKSVGPEGDLTRLQFIGVMQREFPNLRDGSGRTPKAAQGKQASQLAAIFDAFDVDESGSVDMKEFVMGMARLAPGSMDDKFALMFHVYGDGETIPLPYLVQTMEKSLAEANDARAFASDLLGLTLSGMSATISKSSFMELVLGEPLFFHCCLTSIMPDYSVLAASAGDSVRTLLKKSTKMTPEGLKAVWHKHMQAGTITKQLTAEQVKAFLLDEFHAAPEINAAFAGLFSMMPKDAPGFVNTTDVLCGLLQLCVGNSKDKAELLSTMLDEDQNGEIPRSSLRDLMTRCKKWFAVGYDTAATMVSRLAQEEEDGRVKLTEFRDACHRDLRVMEVFARMLGASASAELSGERPPVSAFVQETLNNIMANLDAAAIARTTLAKTKSMGSSDYHKRVEAERVAMAQERAKSKALEQLRRLSVSASAGLIEHMQAKFISDTAASDTKTLGRGLSFTHNPAVVATVDHAQRVLKHLTSNRDVLRQLRDEEATRPKAAPLRATPSFKPVRRPKPKVLPAIKETIRTLAPVASLSEMSVASGLSVDIPRSSSASAFDDEEDDMHMPSTMSAASAPERSPTAFMSYDLLPHNSSQQHLSGKTRSMQRLQSFTLLDQVPKSGIPLAPVTTTLLPSPLTAGSAPSVSSPTGFSSFSPTSPSGSHASPSSSSPPPAVDLHASIESSASTSDVPPLSISLLQSATLNSTQSGTGLQATGAQSRLAARHPGRQQRSSAPDLHQDTLLRIQRSRREPPIAIGPSVSGIMPGGFGGFVAPSGPIRRPHKRVVKEEPPPPHFQFDTDDLPETLPVDDRYNLSGLPTYKSWSRTNRVSDRRGGGRPIDLQ